MKKVLVFCEFYVPGFKGGGGMWLVKNIVERLGDRFRFFIVTRGNDFANDREDYAGVAINAWNDVGKAKVFYLPAGRINSETIKRILDEVFPDVVFLNSVFSSLTRAFLFANLRGLFPKSAVALASTGELSEGALSIKSTKKKAYLAFAKLFGLYRGLIWRASFETEADEIRRIFGGDANIMIAPDIPPREILEGFETSSKPQKIVGEARLVFASRIARKKNLQFLLEALYEIRDVRLPLEIIGPIEDQEQWEQCLALISQLPANIEVNVSGPLPNSELLKHLCDNHFFVLPTLGENFGYVFLEALSAGCPLIVSDQIPWREAETKNFGWLIPLVEKQHWIEILRRVAAMNAAEYSEMSGRAKFFAESWLKNPEIEEATVRLFETAAANNRQFV